MVAPPCLLTLPVTMEAQDTGREATVSRSRFWESGASDNALFTGVRGIVILGSSHTRSSEKFINFNACNYLIIPDDIGSPSGIPGLSGWGYAGVLRPYIVVLLVCLPAKSPRESSPPLWATTHEEQDHNEPKILRT